MKATFIIISATLVMGHSVAAQGLAEKYTPCVDYFSVGNSQCKAAPAAAQPIPPSKAPAPVMAAPQADPVQDFLDNHGKPPREFVEFYLSPTPQNAQKWVNTYRAQQAKANEISQAWRKAEQTQNSQGPAAPRTTPPGAQPAPLPQPPTNPTTNPATSAAFPQNGRSEAASPTQPSARLGAYATPATAQTQLTYYFSASCPFCARLKPDLLAVAQQNASKLLFTCVDLTPLSARQAPAPENREGLPCDWRLPRAGEVETLQVKQTPTLVVTLPGGTPQRLTGSIPRQTLEALVSAAGQ